MYFFRKFVIFLRQNRQICQIYTFSKITKWSFSKILWILNSYIKPKFGHRPMHDTGTRVIKAVSTLRAYWARAQGLPAWGGPWTHANKKTRASRFRIQLFTNHFFGGFYIAQKIQSLKFDQRRLTSVDQWYYLYKYSLSCPILECCE